MYPALANLTTSARAHPYQMVHATVGAKRGLYPPLVRDGDLWGILLSKNSVKVTKEHF